MCVSSRKNLQCIETFVFLILIILSSSAFFFLHNYKGILDVLSRIFPLGLDFSSFWHPFYDVK